MSKHCLNCKYAHGQAVNDAQGRAVVGQKQYTCKRFPPTAIMIPQPGGFMLGSAHPIVTAQQYCSLHEPVDETSFDVLDKRGTPKQ